jgi:very-short-patch-repair endonuclease
MHYLPYKQNLKEFSRRLRNNSTLGEILLWQQLRAGQLEGYSFNRQKPIGQFIVDFYCKRLQLVIEVDGGYHYEEEQILIDKGRQKMMEEMGLHFIRFHDEEIRKDMPQVLQKIKEYISEFKR